MIRLRTLDTRLFIAAAFLLLICVHGFVTWRHVESSSVRATMRHEHALRHELDLVQSALKDAVAQSAASANELLAKLDPELDITLAAVLSPEGRILASAPRDFVGQMAAQAPFARNLETALRPPSTTSVERGAGTTVLAMSPLGDSGSGATYLVMIADPARRIAARERDVWLSAATMSSVALVVALLLGFVYTVYVANPTRKLTGLVRDLGATAALTTLDMRGVGDLAELGRAFSRAGERLAERQAALVAATEEAARHRDRLDLTLRSIGEAVLVTDTRAAIIAVNPRAEALTGWRESDALGQPLASVLPLVLPDTAAPLPCGADGLFAVAPDQHVILHARNGTTHRLALSAAPILDATGSAQGATHILRDVSAEYALRTALETSEQRLRAAIERGDVGLWEWDAVTDAFEHYGTWAQRMTSAGAQPIRFGADHMRLTHPDDRAVVQAALVAHLKGERDIYEVEQRIRAHDGEYRRFLVRGSAVEFAAGGRPRKLIGTYTDITELRDEQQRLEFAMRFARVGFFDWRINVDRLEVSENWLELFGTADNRLANVREDFTALVHPADRAAIRATIVAALQGADSFQTEVRLRRNDGNYAWLLASGTVTERGADGRALRLLGTQVDITHLKLVQDRLELALGAVPQGIIEWWPHDDRIEASASWARLTGHAADSVNSLVALRRLVHPDDVPRLNALARDLAAGDCVSGRIEFRLRFADGSHHWILGAVQVAEYDEDGAPRRVVATWIDISDLKLSEQRLEIALSTARQGVWEWLPQSDRFIASRSWMQLYGFSSDAVSTLNELYATMIHPDDIDNVRRSMNGLRDGRATHSEVSLRARTRDGVYLNVLARATVVERDADGRALRVVGASVDVSELARAREQLELALRTSRQGMFEWQPATDGVSFDPLWYEMTGYGVGEVTTSRAALEMGMVHPDDVAAMRQALLGVHSGTLDDYTLEFRLKRKRGDYIWVLARGVATARDEAGRALRVIGTNVDISDLKQAQARMRMVVEATGVALWEYEVAENRVRFTDDSWMHMTGHALDAYVRAEDFQALQHPEQRVEIAASLAALTSGVRDNFESTLRLRHARGHYVSLLVRGFIAARGGEGGATRIAGTAVDITALKHIERELESSRAMLRTVLDTVPDAIFWKDRESVVQGSNRQFAHEAGFDEPTQVIGLSDFELPWRSLADVVRTEDHRLLEGRTDKIRVQRALPTKDGGERWVETTKVPFRDGDGSVIGVLGVIHDVTTARRAHDALEAERARLEVLIRGSGAGMWDWDLRTGELFVNQRWAEILGYTNIDELAPLNYATWRNRVHPDDLARAELKLRDVVTGNADTYECDVRLRHRSGRWLWVHDAGRCMARDDGGRVTRIAGAFIDVSAKVERDQQLKAIAEAVTRDRRGDLLDTLLDTARELADASHAFVAAIDDDGQHARIIAAAPPQFVGMLYRLLDSPCVAVMVEDSCVLAQAARSLFPRDEVIAQLGVEGYAGQRLTDEDGVPRGLFVLLSTKAFADPERTRAVISILATTAAQELMRERRNLALRDSEMRYRRIYATMPILLATFDGDGRIIDVNEAWVRTSGYALSSCIGQAVTRFFTPASRMQLESLLSTLGSDAARAREPLELVDRRGNVLRTACTLFDSQPAAAGSVRILALEDITARLAAEDRLRVAATAFETHGAMLVLDRECRILEVNQGCLELTGYSRADLIGRSATELDAARTDEDSDEDKWREALACGRFEGETWLRRRDGSEVQVWHGITAVHDAAGEVTHFVSNMVDISERVRAALEIERLAFFDPLTGLPNRRYLQDRLAAAVAHARRHAELGALLFIDLDHFKQINDSMGHAVGDRVLGEVGRRLQDLTRQEDVVSRMGGDEFIVMLTAIGAHEVAGRERAEAVARKITTELSRPYKIETHEFHLTPTIGITLFPSDGATTDDALKEADAAMYSGKADGRNTVRFYQAGMAAAANERLQIGRELRTAIESGQLELHFQPQVNVDSGIGGAEALLRWRHPDRGMIPPDKFIPIAEDSALIHDLGNWVIERALATLLAWRAHGFDELDHVAINVSSRQFNAPDFVANLEQRRARAGIDARCLVLELTERTVVEDIEGTIAKMHELRALGFRFSVDDFGIGYSSLAYLRRLPLDQLKIDRFFVRDVVSDANAGVIAETIIAMGRQLGLETIAEGVETDAQREFLAARGCRAFQGYLFCPPVAEAEFRSYCQRFRAHTA